jgi:HSP20 family molecular chaperone IbpA
MAFNLIITNINNKIKTKNKIMVYSNSDFGNILENFFNSTPSYRYYSSSSTKNTNEEKYEINNTNDGAYLFLEVAGFNKSNLKVEMENGVIYIEGKRVYKLNGEEKSKSISKQFTVGEGYNPASIEATIEDGLLTVFVPNYKKQEKKRISIL